MNIEREIKVRDAIKYCIENFDSETSTNRIIEFWKYELKLQEQQCHIAAVSGLLGFDKGYEQGYNDATKEACEEIAKNYQPSDR